MKTLMRSLARAAVALALLALLPAARAASFTDAAPTLNVDLAASDSVSITSAGATYALTLGAGSWSGTDTANVTGTGTATLTVTATGLANFALVNITDSGTGASVTFADSGANAYSDNFTVTLNNTAAATALTFNGSSAFGANALTVSVDNTIAVSGSASVTATGTGTISLTTTRNIFVGSSATVGTVNGNLTLSANAGGTTTGAFVGVDVSNGLVQATGTGVVSVTGKGGDGAGGSNYGVLAQGGGDIIGGTSGTMTITGTGGPSTGGGNYGVVVTGTGSSITSSGANVTVNGTGGGSGAGSSFNSGVDIGNSFNDGLISAGGTGTVTVIGQGGAGTGGDNYGVRVAGTSSAIITSSGGNVIVTGTGGAGNNFNNGVRVRSSGRITAGGGGTVSVTGTSGPGGGSVNDGVYVLDSGSVITSTGGSVSITGTGSASSAGVKLESSGAINSGGNFPITITSDSFARVTSGSISAGSGTVTFVQRTAGTLINLGGADVLTGSPLTLGLTDAELDSVTAGTLDIGDANSGAITVSAAITHGNNLNISVASAVTFNDAVTMAVNKNLTVTTTSTGSGIDLPTANSDLAATGTGTISLTATRNIALASGSSLTTVNGALTLSANAAGTTTGNFLGVEIFGLVQATGSGNVNVTGRGGNDAGGAQHGVRVRSGGDILGGTSGTVTVTGTGGASSGDFNYGAYVTGAGSTIGSGGASVQIIGQGGGTGTSQGNYGAIAETSGLVTAGGSATLDVQGTGGNGSGSGANQHGVYAASGGDIVGNATGLVTVTGTGGASSGTQNVGVRVDGSGSTITSSGANVQVTGNGGGSGTSIQNIGVFVFGSGAISAGATGTVSITGNGGTTTTGDQNHGVVVQASIASNNGSITLNGTGGGSGTSGINRGIQIGGTSSASIAAAGANNVIMTGTGGSGSGGNNQGFLIMTAVGFTTSVSTAGGNMTFTGTPGGSTTHGIDISGGGTSTSITTGGGNLTLIADGMSLSSTALSLDTGAGSATLRQLTGAGAIAINLGAADAAGTLGLTDAELDYFTATTVNIGNASSGAITVSAAITHGNNLNISVASAVTFNDAVTMAVNKSLTVATTSTASGIDLPTANSDLAATGTGTISLTASRNIRVGNNTAASITTVNGALTLSANAAGTTTGNFIGINVNAGTVQVTGTPGTLSLTGKGGNDSGGSQLGVLVQAAGVVQGGTTGLVTVQGTGGPSSGGSSYGIYVIGGSTITSGGGNVSVTGTGGGSGTSASSHGVLLQNSASQITAGGSGTVTVQGTGGPGSGNNNVGVNVQDSAAISSVSGNVSVTGTGGGTGTSTQNQGVRVQSIGTITAGGTATVTVVGNGGTGSTGNDNYGVLVDNTGSFITSTGGAVSVTGTGGGSGTSGFNYGVLVRNDGNITAGGATSTLDITGNGGTGSGGNHLGISLETSGSQIASSGGNLTLTGTGGIGGSEVGIRLDAGTTVSTPASGGSITLIADKMQLGGSGTIVTDNGNGGVTLRQKTATVAINLGSAVDTTASTLELSDTELDRISATTLNIGNASSGAITVSAAVTRPASTAVALTTGGNIIFNPGSINTGGGTLALNAASGNVQPITSSTDVTASTLSFASGTDLSIGIDGTTADTQYRQLNIAGGVNLANVDLAVTGTHTVVVGDQFVIVNNDGADAVAGTFNGLAEGTFITTGIFGTVNGRVSYVGGSGNDVVITARVSADTYLDLVGGDLIINGSSAVDSLTVSLNGANVRIRDSVRTLSAGAGMTQIDLNTVELPVASITGAIVVNGGDANDKLTVDLSGGDPIPAGGVTFNGQGQTGSPGDTLAITGGTTQGTVTYSYSSPNDGNVVMSNFGTITYTGLEPIVNSGTAADVIFNLPAGPNTVTLGDDGTGANGLSRLSGATFETTDFSNPTGSLTINRGNAADTLTINSTPDFTATLTVGSGASPFAAVTVAGTVTLASGKNLSIDSSATVSFSTASSDVTLSGAGAAAITTTRNIAFTSGSSLRTADGNLTLSANATGATTGNFRGVDVNAGLVQATGTGVVTVTGKGGDDAGGNQIGVLVQGGGDIIGGTTGTMIITGAGGPSTANANFGIGVTDSGSTITSGGANVQLTGTSAGTGVGSNIGVLVAASGSVSAGGAGTVTVQGTGGGTVSGDDNWGVGVSGTSAQITSSGGSVSVTGTGGGAGGSASNYGVRVQNTGQITAGSTGTVTVQGTGGAGAGASNHGVSLRDASSFITSGGGNVQVTGIEGAGTSGVAIFAGSSASLTTATSGGMLTLIGNSMSIDSTAVISAQAASSVTLRQNTASVAIDVGTGTDTIGGPLGLSDAELDRVTAGTVFIGNSSSGAITVSAAITHGNNLNISVASAITINQSVTMDVANKSLTVATTGTGVAISLPNGTSDLSATGTGTISLTAAKNIFLGSGASVATVNGNLTLSANSAGTTTGPFVGVDVSGGTVQATGSGVVSVTGRGGDNAGGGNHGVLVQSTGSITGGTAGTMTVNGTGGPSSGTINHGVFVNVGSTISSGGASVQVTGQGGGTGASGNNYGVFLNGSATISAGGSGTVTVLGTGGATTGSTQLGVYIAGVGTITSSGGNVQVTGQGGGSGASTDNYGIYLQAGGKFTAGVSGTVTVQGTGGAGTGAANYGVNVTGSGSSITSSGGNVSVTGIEGAGTSGIAIVTTSSGSLTTAANGGTLTLIGNSMNFDGTAVISAQAASSVTLRQFGPGIVAIDIGTVTDTISGPLGLSDAELDRVTAGTINIGNASSGAITVSAAITADDSVSLTSGSTIAFNNTFDLSGTTKSLTVDSVGAITINTTAISTTGAQTYQDAVSLTAGPTITATTVTFNSTVNGSQALTITGNAVFGDGGTDAVGGTTALTSVSVSGTTTFNISSAADVSTTGAQTYSGAVTLTLPVVLGSTGSGDITFGSTVNGAQGLTANTGGITRFQGVVGGGARLASLSTDAGGTTRIETTGISTVGGVSFNDAVVLGADATVDNTTAATIRFFSTVNSDNAGTKRDLTVTATAGGSAIQFDAAVGGGIPLDVVTINNAGTYTTLAAADFFLDGAFSQAGAGAASGVAGDITTTGDTISFNSSVTLTDNVALNTTSGSPAGANITFSVAVNADAAANNRTLTLTAGTGGAISHVGNVGATTRLGTYTISSGASASLKRVHVGSGGISVTATAITLDDNGTTPSITTDAVSPAGNVSLAGSVTLATGITIDTDHATLTDGNINFGTLADNGNGAFRTLNLTAGGGAVTFTTSPGALNLEVDGTVAGTSHDRINVTGTINLNNTVLTIPNSTIASSIGQTLTLIDNDGTGDAVAGTFNGQAQNSLVSINGSSFRISYTGGDGNDVTLTEATDIQVTLTGDDLTVDDASNTADNLTITLNGANVRISDSSKILSAGPGTTQVNANTVEVPLASLSPAGSITVNGNGGNDTLTRNFTGGNIDVPVTWNGGAQTVSDTLVVTGGGTFALVTHTFANNNDGSVAVTGNGLISYTGLEPVTDNLSATDRVFTFSTTAETITLTDSGGADGNMTIDSDVGGESVTFANPTTSITINAGDTGNDQVTITSVDAAYTGSLTIDGGTGTDNIIITAIAPTISALTTTSETLAALPTLSIGAGGLNLTTSAGAISQAGATTLTVTGTATLAAGAANNITLANVGNNFSTVVVTSGNDVSLRDAGAINLGTSTVSGSLTVNAGGLIDFTGAGASTVGTTMGLTTTAGGITDSGAGTLAVTGTSTLAAGAANNITLNNNNNFTTLAITTGNNVTINDTVANLTLNASTVSGTLSVNVTAAGAVFTLAAGATTVAGTATLAADDMTVTGTLSVNAGAGIINLRQFNAARPIALGANTAGSLGLTDAEVDNISAGTINFGDASSGAVTISAGGINRAAATVLTVTTAANNNIAFAGASSLNGTGGGDITLTASGTGAITRDTATTHITGQDISLNAGSGGIGAAGNAITLNSLTVAAATTGNADIYLADTGTTAMQALNAGTGTIFLTSGTFQVAAAGATAITGKLDISGTLDQVAAARLITGGNASDTVTVQATGTVVIYRTGATPYSDLFNATVATGRTPPTLVSGSTINWQSAAATTVDLTTFENVNFNGAGPFALSGNTTVTTAGNTMTVSTGSHLNTGAFFVQGAGNFTLQSDGTLGIGSAAGITSAGATGSIRVTGTRSFNASGDYLYNGVALQVTGNGLPVTITTPGSLTINNASNVELTQDTTADLLVLTSGRFFTENGGGDRLLTTTAPISGGGAGSYVVGRLARSFIVGAQDHVFHIGDAANYSPFDLAPGAANFTVTTGGTLTARVFPDYGGSTAALHPNLTAPVFPAAGWQPIAGLEPTETIDRYWRLTPSGGLAGSYFPAATYADADLNVGGTDDETRFVLRRYNNDGIGTMWHLTPNNNRTPVSNTVFVDSAGATPVTQFGDFAVGEQKISFYTLSHPNSVGEEISVNFGLTVTPRDYLGGAVLSGHESVTLTYNAYYANSATVTANFTFNTSGSPYSGAGAFTTGSQTVTGRGTVRETLDIVVMDGSSRTGILEDLIIGNAPTAALAGTGVRLDGTGYGLTDNLGPEFTDESITVEMWFNVDATGTGGVLFDERGAANTLGYRASWIEAVGPVGGPYEIRLRVWNIPQAINGNNPRTTGLAIGTVTAGGWHHVTLRYDKALLRLDGFLDGVKSASFITGDRTTPFEVNASNPVVREGIFFGIGLADDQHLGNGLGFKGDLDELRIWNGARSDAQILDNWAKTVDPASTGLVAYYHFDDGSGTVAQDATANGFDLAFASLTPPASYTPTWVSSTALSGVTALTYDVEVGETVVITLDGFDPEDTGTLTANVGAVTGSWGVNANLRQYDNTLINAGGVAVTDSARRVKVQGLAGGGPLTFQYTVNNGIANSPAITITVNVVGATGAPTINASGTVAPASNEDTSPVTITRAQIAAALAAADPAPGPGATIAFRVRSLVNGKLQINGTNVVDNSTFITGTAPLNSVTWYPPANVSGIVDAFIVDAYDGSTPADGQYSANTGIVRVNLTALNDAPITQVVTTALDFDGTDDYLFTPNLRSAFSNETVTLEVWFRPSTNASGQIVPGAIISERGQNGLTGWRNTTLELLPSGQVKARIWNITAINLGTVDTNNWNHAVVRYDKSTLKVSGFLNRVASSTLAGGVGNGDRKAPWEDGRFALHYDIGAPNDMNLGSGARFKGQVAEFRVWTIARTDAAILGSYLGADLTNERGLLAWYKLDEAVGPAGATTPDDSVNNLDATLFGTPQFVNVHPMIAVAGSYVIKLPAIDVENQTMTWVVNTTAAQLNGGKLYHNLGGAVGAEIPTDAAIALFPVANGTVYYVPPSGGPADHEIYFYVADASGAVSTTASVKISVTAALRRAGDYAGGGAGDGAGLSYAGSSGAGMSAGGSGASGGGSGGGSGFGTASLVQLVTPADGSGWVSSDTATVIVAVSPLLGQAAFVEVFADGESLGLAVPGEAGIWALSVNGVPSGTYQLRAVAVDSVGTAILSLPVTVTVLP